MNIFSNIYFLKLGLRSFKELKTSHVIAFTLLTCSGVELHFSNNTALELVLSCSKNLKAPSWAFSIFLVHDLSYKCHTSEH